MIKSFGSSQAMSEYIDSKIDGSFLPSDIDFLGKYVRELKAGDIFMEIGTDYGKSMASAIWQAEDGVRFFTCDLIDKKAKTKGRMSRKEFFQSEDIDSVCTFLGINGLRVAKKWQEELAMVFIDGEHTYDAVKADIQVWYSHLKKGGFMLFHDYLDPQFSLQIVVDQFVKNSDKFTDFTVARDIGLLNSSMAGAVKA